MFAALTEKLTSTDSVSSEFNFIRISAYSLAAVFISAFALVASAPLLIYVPLRISIR